MPNLLNNTALPRRTLLRGLGVALALPLLDAMRPAVLSAAERKNDVLSAAPRRMLGICNNLGLLPEKFFPTDSGSGYTLSPYLQDAGSTSSGLHRF